MRWRRFFHRTHRDSDHAREFQAFLELETDENIASGMSPEAARRAAHLKFGNPTAIREEVYEMNSLGFLETLGRDIRYAGRVLKAVPTFTMVGKRLTVRFGPPEGIRAEIIGVAADVRSALDSRPNDIIYLHYPQGVYVAEMHLVLRADARSQAAGVSAFGRAVRAAVASLDPEQPVYRIRTMDEMLRVSLATRRFEMLLLGVFAAFAACLAAVGLYGVLAYSVQARTREIGIRTALGANHGQVLALVLGEALKLTAIGLVAGVLGALGLTRLLSTLLYGVQPTDPTTFGVVSLLLLAVAVAAGSIPARRPTRIDPMIALRHE